MDLHVTVSASEFDEHYEMALVYCFDQAKNYCFSLTRFPDSEEIEIMVHDQVNHRVNDLRVDLNFNSIDVALSNEVSKNLDGHASYSILFNPSETDINELDKAFKKIFEGKSGFKNKTTN